MNDSRKGWIAGLVFLLVLVSVPIWYFTRAEATVVTHEIDKPWDFMPRRAAHVDHKDLFEGPFETGQEVTLACLSCHEEAADQVMHTAHWLWESKPVQMEGRDEPVTVGKRTPSTISASGSRAIGQVAPPAMPDMAGKTRILISRKPPTSTAWFAMTAAVATRKAKPGCLSKASTCWLPQKA